VSLDSAATPPAAGRPDIVGDRDSLVRIGLAAVWLACLIFAVMRLVVTMRTGKLTPWWGNAAGVVAITILFLWYRLSPKTRSAGAAHGTALVATLALLLPIAYGMTSTIWWLSLVGFAMVLLARQLEAKVWGVLIPALVAGSVLAEPYVQIPGAAGEPFVEAALAKIVYVLILMGMAVGFRRVAERRAIELHESEAELRRLRTEFEARALSGEDLAARRLVRVEHLNSVLRAIRNVNQLIVHERDPAKLVRDACHLLVETRGYAGVWIGLAAPDGSVAGWAEAGWGESFQPLARQLERGQWPACQERAFRAAEGTPFEPDHACESCPLWACYEGRTVLAAVLRHDQRTFGLLGVALPRHLTVDEEERGLIAEVAGDLAFALHDFEAHALRQRAEEATAAAANALAERNRLLAETNRFIEELTALPAEASAAELITRRVRQITGAVAVGFSEYQPDSRTLRVRGLDMEPGLVQKVVSLFGRRIEEVESPLSPEALAEITTTIVGRRRTLTECTFGAVPPAVGSLAQKLVGADRFIGLAHMIEGRLYGTSLLALKVGQPDPPDDHLESLAHMIAISLRRNTAEADLRFQRMLLASQNEASLDGILIVDADGTIIWHNRKLVELWGIPDAVVESRSDKTALDAILDKVVDADAFAAGVSELYSQRTVSRRDEILLRDGRVIDRYSSPVVDERGRYLGRLWLFRDVTEQRQAELRLRESERKFATLFSASPASTALTTIADGRFIDANQAFLECFEFSREQLIGRTTVETGFHDDDGRTSVLRRVMDNRATLDVEMRTRTGKRRQMLLRGERITIDAQPCLLAVGVDISERKHAEEERQQLQASLAQSDRLASMGMLAAGVAHEINNPLSYVLYNLESVLEDLPQLARPAQPGHQPLAATAGPTGAPDAPDDAQGSCDPAALGDVVERLSEALSGMQRIKNIARSLGTFSRVERTNVEPVDIQACVEHAATMAFNELKYRARLVRDFSAVPPVLATDGKLSQVFLNLFINAAHAIGEGHVEQNEVRVRTWAEGDTVCAAVSDTGKGVAPEHRDRIFEPFFTTKGIGVGSGLGLSICKKIIEEFGGEISFSSEVGKGTSFVIRLPRMPRESASQERVSVAPAAAGAAVRGRVLVVDDDTSVRSAIVRMLKPDHEVLSAASGVEARELLERDRRFDVIFCDLMMPEMSGMELHAWLAGQDPELAGQIVFVTGGAFTPGAADYLARVANRRVEKPFAPAAFRKMTDELVLAARAKRGG
jgi:PAS domain S-box-containing protein